MREILFRAKRMDNGEWVESGCIIQFLDNGVRSFYMPQFNTKCICTHDYVTDDILEFTNCRFYKVDPETVCQYTGLTDNNGKKIWENDICIIHSSNIDEEDGYFTVEWDDDGARIVLNGNSLTVDFDNFYGHECEVIGNIFDNPDLLEVPE